MIKQCVCVFITDIYLFKPSSSIHTAIYHSAWISIITNQHMSSSLGLHYINIITIDTWKLHNASYLHHHWKHASVVISASSQV